MFRNHCNTLRHFPNHTGKKALNCLELLQRQGTSYIWKKNGAPPILVADNLQLSKGLLGPSQSTHPLLVQSLSSGPASAACLLNCCFFFIYPLVFFAASLESSSAMLTLPPVPQKIQGACHEDRALLGCCNLPLVPLPPQQTMGRWLLQRHIGQHDWGFCPCCSNEKRAEV